jgi:SAM-dependent methyltransferase
MAEGGVMPTIQENKDHWSEYDWSQRGDEWSEVWGDSDALWHTTLWPRIRAFLGTAETVLEIAPGFGRLTQFLKLHCRRLVVVDLAEPCVAACRERFRDDNHIDYFTNDGRSLPMIANRSIDFAFSFDSLVHSDLDAVKGYVSELARILRPNGVGFLHHSNVGAFIDPETGKVTIANKHWRGTDVDARRFRELCESAGLSCVLQELVPWGGAPELSDCLSLFTPAGSRWQRPVKVVENPRFMQEAVRVGNVVKLYSLE